MTQGKGDSQSIELRTFFRELSCLSEMSEKLSTPDESHNEEYLVVSLEYEVHSN
jgi:hypothetical protein